MKSFIIGIALMLAIVGMAGCFRGCYHASKEIDKEIIRIVDSIYQSPDTLITIRNGVADTVITIKK